MIAIAENNRDRQTDKRFDLSTIEWNTSAINFGNGPVRRFLIDNQNSLIFFRVLYAWVCLWQDQIAKIVPFPMLLKFCQWNYLNSNVSRRIKCECNDIEPGKQRPTLFHLTKQQNAYQNEKTEKWFPRFFVFWNGKRTVPWYGFAFVNQFWK